MRLGRHAGSIKRLIQLLGRLVLWGCVLILLVRGIASFASPQASPVSHRTAAFGAQQPPSGIPGRVGGDRNVA